MWLDSKVKSMVRVWVAGKTVSSHCYTWAISELFRDKGLTIKRYINSSVYFTLLYLARKWSEPILTILKPGTRPHVTYGRRLSRRKGAAQKACKLVTGTNLRQWQQVREAAAALSVELERVAAECCAAHRMPPY